MKAELIEKGDGVLVIRYTAGNPYEAMQMSLVTSGYSEDEHVALSSYSGSRSSNITVGSAAFKVIADLQEKAAK